LELIANVKHLADKMQHIKGIGIILVIEHLAYQGSKMRKTLPNDLVERVSILIQFKFKPSSEGKKPLQTSIYTLSIPSFQITHNLLKQIWKLVWEIINADHL
jgi:hypothetical protein